MPTVPRVLASLFNRHLTDPRAASAGADLTSSATWRRLAKWHLHRQEAAPVNPQGVSGGADGPSGGGVAGGGESGAGGPSGDDDKERLIKLMDRAKRAIANSLGNRLPNLDLQALLQSIPTRLGRPDLAAILKEAAAKVPSPAEVRALAAKYLTADELVALTRRVIAEALNEAVDVIVEGAAIRKIRDRMMDNSAHPELAREARVRVGTDLCEQEREYVAQRRVVVARALTEFLGEEVDPRDAPIIGIAGSGGGCRAMVSCLGSVRELEKLGLLNACTYMAGVSGSTWAMAQIYGVGKGTEPALKHSKWALSSNLMNPLDFLESISGAGPASESVLTAAFLIPEEALKGPFPTAKNQVKAEAVNHLVGASKLSAQDEVVRSQKLPFPIYSSVTRVVDETSRERGDLYQWLEFTPYEVGMTSVADPGVSPALTEGAKADFGTVPETHLGIYLGVWGSAFTADFARIIEEISDVVPAETGRRLENLLKSRLSQHPITPTAFPNPMYGLEGNDPILSRENIPVMDAGMDNSIPFAPLLREEREVDVVLVFDASSRIGSHPFIRRGEEFAIRRGLDLTVPHGATRSVIVKKDSVGDPDVYKGPRAVVYMPLVKGKLESGEEMDPHSEKFAVTHNFFWKREEVEKVAELAGSSGPQGAEVD
ncbi:hypothetical protein HK101_000616 [Irineochytrium annulatum]|nr:hypothetical protein HK101_000616 [Irineochytrium annulatum]